MDEQGLDTVGERIFNLQRAIFIREGHKGRAGDCLPEFDHTVPLPLSTGLNPKSSVPGKKGEAIFREGAVVDKGKFEKMKDEYYDLRGWNIKTGMPTKESLEGVGLRDIADALEARGKL